MVERTVSVASTHLFLSAAQLAERWAMSKYTIYKWVRDGRIPFTRIGNSLRFSLADVEGLEATGYTPTVEAETA